MEYLALYRKWRPKVFEDMIGQEHITRTLKNAVKNGRVSHAYLFCGPRGTGKTSAAKILAKALNCEKGPAPVPCNQCSLCVGINRGRVMDVLEIDAASNRGIDEIRELRDKVRYGSAQARFKVYIIDEVHMLTPEAFNALLKTLEEPPENVVFILATTEPHKLPQTILSRCQRFDFRRIPIPVLIQGLSRVASGEKSEVEEDVLHLIARNSEGGMRDALGLLEQVISYSGDSITLDSAKKILGVVEEEIFLTFGEAVLANNLIKGLKIIEEVVDSGHDIGKFLRDMSSYFRSLVLLKMQGEGPLQLEIPWSSLEIMREQSRRFSHEGLMSVIEFLGESITDLRGSSQPRFVLEVAVFKICQVDYHLNLKNLQQKLEYLEKMILEGYKSSSEEKKGREITSDGPADVRLPEEAAYLGERIEVSADSAAETSLAVEKEEPVKAEKQPSKFFGLDTQPLADKASSLEENRKQSHSETKDFSSEEMKKIWKKFLGLLLHKDVKVHSMLNRGRPVSCENGIITVAVENFICQEKLNSKENCATMTESFQRLTGQEIKFRFVLRDTDAEDKEEGEDDFFPEDAAGMDQGQGLEGREKYLDEKIQGQENDGEYQVERAAEMFGGKIIDTDKNKRGGIFDV